MIERIPTISSTRSLFQWFLNGRSRGTFLKTLYLGQIPTWKEEWSGLIQQKGGIEAMNDDDWTSLLKEDDTLHKHAPFILPLAFSFMEQIETNERRK